MKSTSVSQKPKNALDGTRGRKMLGRFRREMGYHFLIWPAIIFVFIFNYIPTQPLYQ